MCVDNSLEIQVLIFNKVMFFEFAKVHTLLQTAVHHEHKDNFAQKFPRERNCTTLPRNYLFIDDRYLVYGFQFSSKRKISSFKSLRSRVDY